MAISKNLKFNYVFHLFIFLIGLSIGFISSFYLKSFSNTIQTSFFSVFPSPQTLPPAPQPPPPTLPLLSQPPPPLLSSSIPTPAIPPRSPLEIISLDVNVNKTSNKAANITSILLNEQTRMMYNMSDEELFQRALVVSSNMTQESSIKEKNIVPKVAFMFLTPGPIPLSPLWELFFKGHQGLYSIYVHPHPSYNDTTPRDSVFFGTRITSQQVYWGDISMIEAERRLLANALLDPSNQRFVLLSQSCIPLFNFTTTYNYLINSYLSYIGDENTSRLDRGRYNPQMFPTITIQDWRKGSQWFEVHRELALRIVSDHKYYGLFREFCHHPCFNDEHYIPTMVHSLYGGMNSNRSITYVDWSRIGPHPRRFVGNEITEELLNSIRFGSSGCDYNGKLTRICVLFARKFTKSTLQPLLRFAPLLFGNSTAP